ncbi:MAG TPA: winged helix-turn-helix domain-containing protein [Vicinamibacterales bacterium]|nr:winged helix-turn-helix domain-containing protein [Vicinamibacterales bacterium]
MPLTFHDVRIDLAARQLWQGTVEIHLSRKAFDLLALLVERRPEAVSKEDIHARLWPDTFVSEITLHSLVSEIRRALDDKAGEPRFVRTVHGFGYAFVCPPDDRPASPQPARRRVRGWLILDRERLPVFDGDNVFGRGDGDSDVIDLPSSTVSRRHARIHVDEHAWIEDLGSKNGTFVREQPITGPVLLSDGDRLRFASLRLTFRLTRSPELTSTQSTSDIPARKG